MDALIILLAFVFPWVLPTLVQYVRLVWKTRKILKSRPNEVIEIDVYDFITLINACVNETDIEFVRTAFGLESPHTPNRYPSYYSIPRMVKITADRPATPSASARAANYTGSQRVLVSTQTRQKLLDCWRA